MKLICVFIKYIIFMLWLESKKKKLATIFTDLIFPVIRPIEPNFKLRTTIDTSQYTIIPTTIILSTNTNRMSTVYTINKLFMDLNKCPWEQKVVPKSEIEYGCQILLKTNYTKKWYNYTHFIQRYFIKIVAFIINIILIKQLQIYN